MNINYSYGYIGLELWGNIITFSGISKHHSLKKQKTVILKILSVLSVLLTYYLRIKRNRVGIKIVIYILYEGCCKRNKCYILTSYSIQHSIIGTINCEFKSSSHPGYPSKVSGLYYNNIPSLPPPNKIMVAPPLSINIIYKNVFSRLFYNVFIFRQLNVFEKCIYLKTLFTHLFITYS